MHAIEKIHSFSIPNFVQNIRAFTQDKTADIAHAILTAPHNAQSAQYVLLSMMAISPLFNLAHLAFLKCNQTDNHEWKEKATISFCNKAVITAKIVSVIFFALIPVSLYLGMTQGITSIRNRNFSDFIKAIRNISSAIGFCIPLSTLLFQIKPVSIANELILQTSGFIMPTEYQETSLIEKLEKQNLQITSETLRALKLPDGTDNDDIKTLALASRGLRTWEDFKKEKIVDQKSFVDYLNAFKSPGPSPALSKIRKNLSDKLLMQHLQLPENCTDKDLIRETLSSKGLTSLKDLKDHEILKEQKDESQDFIRRLEQYLNIFKLEHDIEKSPAYDLLQWIAFNAEQWENILQALECERLPESILLAMKKNGLRTIQDLFKHKILKNQSKKNAPTNVFNQLLDHLVGQRNSDIALPLISLLSSLPFLYKTPDFAINSHPIFVFTSLFACFMNLHFLRSQTSPLLQILILSISNIFNRLIPSLIQVKSLEVVGFIWAVAMQLSLAKKIVPIFKRISLHLEYYSRSMPQPISNCQHIYLLINHTKPTNLFNYYLRGIQMGLSLKALVNGLKKYI